MDYLKTIKLGFGSGKQACWMTALNSHIGGEWSDTCDCVDPIINTLCIGINDAYGFNNEARTEDIMNFGLFRPLGTHLPGTYRVSFAETPRAIKAKNTIIDIWIPTVSFHVAVSEFYVMATIVRFFSILLHDEPNNRPFLLKYAYPLLDELITMGLHAPEEPKLPACGVSKFLELVGAKT